MEKMENQPKMTLEIELEKVPVKVNLWETSLPYFGVKLSCVCLMFADRKKYPIVTLR